MAKTPKMFVMIIVLQTRFTFKTEMFVIKLQLSVLLTFTLYLFNKHIILCII